jgi:hypothetical protein
MNSVSSLIALTAVLVISAYSAAQAAPISTGFQGLIGATDVVTPVEQVHGCHRHYSQGMQGWHRHGADCTLRRDVAEGKRRKKL